MLIEHHQQFAERVFGDLDSGQILPVVKRTGDDHAYVVAIADAVFGTHASGVQRRTEDERTGVRAGGMRTVPEEVLWILGAEGVRDYESPSAAPRRQSTPESRPFWMN